MIPRVLAPIAGLVGLLLAQSCSLGILFFSNDTYNHLIESTYVGKYKLGDTGPAGGLVFYDKGSVTNGWQYLEAAPSDLAATVAWSTRWTPSASSDLSSSVGAGKANTKTIVNSQSTGVTAAEQCTQLSVGGFADWFLPSRDELAALYYGLASQKLGNFSPKSYWSSSYYTSTSSSSSSSTGAWFQDFSSGTQDQNSATSLAYLVRPIRSF
ncbi:MAG: DUF1566 domain-containing protein [Spirochaetales bacterium]